jgi:hypothetical protein
MAGASMLLASLGAATAQAQDGSIVAWGDNSDFQCEVPSANSGFVAVAGGWGHSLGLKSDGSIAASASHSLGLKSDLTIVAWGDNYAGQCDVPEPYADFVAVAAGWGYGLGLKGPVNGVDDGHPIVSGLRVLAAPNPSTGSVVIRCLLPQRDPATVVLFDASGRMVRRLHEGDLPAGETPFSWDGRDDAGRDLPAGVYLVKVTTPAGEASGRMVLTR